MKKPVATILRVFGALFLVAALGIGFLMWQFERPPFPLSRLDSLHGRMSTNDVSQFLGPPVSAWTNTNETGQAYSKWAYSRVLSWPIVYVYFKPDGTFEKHEYDY